MRLIERLRTYTQHFEYDGAGRFTTLRQDDALVAQYGYDRFGNVTYAMDSHGLRRFQFDTSGAVSAALIDELNLTLRANTLGLLEFVSWGDKSLNIAYDEVDRVASLRFASKDGIAGSEYQYDSRGLRAAGRYDLLENLGLGQPTLDYDEVGNLIEITHPLLNGAGLTIRHTIDSRNQVRSLTPVGREISLQSFDYDLSGRLVRMSQGPRAAEFTYDELGRLTDVYLDDNHVLAAQHGAMDVDPVLNADERTPYTVINEPIASSVYATLDRIVYTRTLGTPYRFLRFEPAMARFVVGELPVPSPDASVLSSLRRRNVASYHTLNPSPLIGFDKPSNILFVPPEYFSLNCGICVPDVVAFDLEMTSATPVLVGQSVNFEADAGWSMCYSYFFDGETYEEWSEPEVFIHKIYVDGNHTATLAGPLGYENHEYLEFPLSFSTSGTKTVVDQLKCGACTHILLAQAQENVDVYYPLQIESGQ